MSTELNGRHAPEPHLRVALITGNYNYVIDGVSLTMNRLVGFMERAGVPVRVFSPVGKRPVFEHEGELVSVPSIGFPGNPYRLGLGLPPAAKRELRRFAPTLVHLCTPDWLGVSALRWARLHGIPAVTTFHTHFSSYLKYYRLGFLERLVWWAQRWFYRRCAEVYVAAPSMTEELRRHGVDANFTEAPFGVDPDQFHPGQRSMEWRRSIGVADDEVLVCFVGRLVWEKGLAMFADVLNGLKKDGVKFRALVVGDGPARAEMQARLPDAVYTGYLTDHDLARAFASSDVFFFPSASETFGCVTVEAMASGLAVVVADAAGSRDIVRNGVDGIVCPPNDRSGFSQAVRRLIESTPARENLRQQALRRAASYQWDIVLGDMLENYNRVLRHWPLRPRQ
jgi:phosphatidylinositol alpha 1,6-mannosyltransferase